MNWVKLIGLLTIVAVIVAMLASGVVMFKPFLIGFFSAAAIHGIYALYRYLGDKKVNTIESARVILEAASRSQYKPYGEEGVVVYWYCDDNKVWAHGEYDNPLGMDDVVSIYEYDKEIATFKGAQAKELFNLGKEIK